MLIRQETDSDIAAIDAVHVAAFGALTPAVDPVEGDLVRALRSDPGWIEALSLVAERPGGDPDRPEIVGHVVCTLGSIGDLAALGLGPLGVLPEYQGAAVGSALMHAVIAAADALEYPVVVLLGHREYYPRFGFVSAADVGITPTDPTWEPGFQARVLRRWVPSMRGEFKYAAPFYDL
jgi:putative acetyltransferase